MKSRFYPLVLQLINMANSTSKPRLIAPVVNKMRLGDEKNNATYWRTLPYQARIEALEEIRAEYHRWKANDQPGFQRIYSIVKR